MEYCERKRSKWFGLPLSFTKYHLTEEKITIIAGFFNVEENDAMMYKVQDVRLNRTLWDRICGVGTITCYTGDTTHPELKLIRIKHAHEIKDFLIDASEEARRKRRTLHSLGIGADSVEQDDLNDMIDD